MRAPWISIAIVAVALGCSSGDDAEELVDAAADAALDASSLDASAQDAGADAQATHDAGVTPAPEGEPWALLSQWGLFRDIASQTPSARVLQYAVNAQLYADEADKQRFVWIPEGTTIEYDATKAWHFPVGTVLVKTFAYDRAMDGDAGAPQARRLLETRLLVHESDRWRAHTYVYVDGQHDAQRKVAGARIEVSFIDANGAARENRYTVPNTNQCGDCHGREGALDTLGGTTRQWNRAAPDTDQNQIERLIELGWLIGAAPASERQQLVDPFGDAPLVDRLRAYADANCGHCHNDDPESGDDGSGLLLRYEATDPETAMRAANGVCKMPQSAGGATCGRSVDIVPGAPDDSIMMCRLESEDPQVQMPPLGRNLRDEGGIALIREWIASLDGSCE